MSRAITGRLLDVTQTVDLVSFESASFYDQLKRVQVNTLSRPLTVVQGIVGIVGGLAGAGGLVISLATVQPLLVPVLLAAGLPLFLLHRRSGRGEYAFALAQVSVATRERFYLVELLTGRGEAKEVRAFALGVSLASLIGPGACHDLAASLSGAAPGGASGAEPGAATHATGSCAVCLRSITRASSQRGRDPGCRSAGSVGAAAGENGLDGPQQDGQVEQRRPILHVGQIQAHALLPGQ